MSIFKILQIKCGWANNFKTANQSDIQQCLKEKQVLIHQQKPNMTLDFQLLNNVYIVICRGVAQLGGLVPVL